MIGNRLLLILWLLILRLLVLRLLILRLWLLILWSSRSLRCNWCCGLRWCCGSKERLQLDEATGRNPVGEPLGPHQRIRSHPVLQQLASRHRTHLLIVFYKKVLFHKDKLLIVTIHLQK